MTIRVRAVLHALSTSPAPCSPRTLPPITLPRRARIADEVTLRVEPSRAAMMPNHKPTSVMLQPRRPTRPVLPRAWTLELDELVDELLDDEVGVGRLGERPSWCTHAGVTVARTGHRACLRCGAVL